MTQIFELVTDSKLLSSGICSKTNNRPRAGSVFNPASSDRHDDNRGGRNRMLQIPKRLLRLPARSHADLVYLCS
jgi:hypothetical protein